MHALSVIQLIAASSGHTKRRVINEHPEIKEILEYCYNPFKRYHIKAPTTSCGGGIRHFSSDSLALLDRLASRELSGYSALQVVKNHIKSLYPIDAEVFKLVLNKDLRAGISSKTINAVWPGLIPIHDIMRGQKYALINNSGRVEMQRAKITKPHWSSPKIDGLRGKLTHGKLYTRNGHEILGMDHITKAINHGFDGEIVIPGVDFYRSSGFIRDHTPQPTAEYHIFDAPSLVNATFAARLEYIIDVLKIVDDPRIKVVPHKRIESHEEAVNEYCKHRAMGYEGSMIKPLDFKYKGSRSVSWLKLKNFDTYDLEVVGKYEGQGKYRGMLGGIIVDFKGVEVKVGSGFSDRERQTLMESLPCMVAEIHAHEVTPDGSLREPRFKGWRFDKDV